MLGGCEGWQGAELQLGGKKEGPHSCAWGAPGEALLREGTSSPRPVQLPLPLSGYPGQAQPGWGGCQHPCSIWQHLSLVGPEGLGYMRVCLQTRCCSSELLQSKPSSKVKGFFLSLPLPLHHSQLPNPGESKGWTQGPLWGQGCSSWGGLGWSLSGRASILCDGSEVACPASDGASLPALILQSPVECWWLRIPERVFFQLFLGINKSRSIVAEQGGSGGITSC